MHTEHFIVGNDIREAIPHLPELDDEECADLLETLNESGVADQRPVAAPIGLAAYARVHRQNASQADGRLE